MSIVYDSIPVFTHDGISVFPERAHLLEKKEAVAPRIDLTQSVLLWPGPRYRRTKGAKSLLTRNTSLGSSVTIKAGDRVELTHTAGFHLSLTGLKRWSAEVREAAEVIPSISTCLLLTGLKHHHKVGGEVLPEAAGDPPTLRREGSGVESRTPTGAKTGTGLILTWIPEEDITIGASSILGEGQTVQTQALLGMLVETTETEQRISKAAAAMERLGTTVQDIFRDVKRTHVGAAD